MVTPRQTGSVWLLGWMFFLAVGLHASVVTVLHVTRPIPPPELRVAFQGKGAGLVMSVPAGLSCQRNCVVPFARGTEVQLMVVVEEGSTFEGWAGACENISLEESLATGKSALSCALTIEGDTEVIVQLGKVPEQIEVAWAKLPEDAKASARKEFTVTLPDPEIEAELLIEELSLPVPEEVQPEEVKPPTPPPPQEVATAPAPAVQQPQQPPPNMISVEVPDENEVEEAPDDAAHLSDKNRDVAEETAAEETNLVREQKGEQVASAESDIQSEEIGAEEHDISQLEETEPNTLEDVRPEEIVKNGDAESAVGAVVGEDGQDGEEGDAGDGTEAQEPGLLAMRGVEGRGPIVDDDQSGQGGKAGAVGRRGRTGIKTQLEFEDYQRIVGNDQAESEVKLGHQRVSARRGRWEKKLGMVKSALENFTPDVRPGNQTALKTRAAPFAVYIARMHRRIHELWGFGFLEDLDRKPADHPLNNWDLYTEIELVINSDGSVHKTTIVSHSGRLEFDVAAIDTLLTASPYEPTPTKIRSPDGRVYLRWGFYRNWRQCGTFNVNPFILSEAPKGEQVDDGALVRDVPKRDRDKARAAAEKASEKAAEAAAKEAASEAARAESGLLSAKDPAALHAANLWITGFTKGSVDKMLGVSAAPFRSGDAVVANSVDEIGNVYRTIMKETGGALRDWKLMSSAGFRKRFGTLPVGVEDGKNQLLMVVAARDQQFTLVLESKDGVFRMVALHR